jgi:prepilin-type N-terminal cleavage/methylation domain-containing protein
MKKSDGFTLIEVLASIVILSLLLTSFFQFFIFSQKTTASNKEKLVAINVAQSAIEEIRDGKFSEITDKAKTTGTIYPKTYEGPANCNDPDVTKKTECLDRYKFTEGNFHFYITVEVGAERKDSQGVLNGLHNVTVYVYKDNGKKISSVKGVIGI